jgi:hypothetical protein
MVVQHESGDGIVDAARGDGSARMSATTHGGLARALQASRSKERSAATRGPLQLPVRS